MAGQMITSSCDHIFVKVVAEKRFPGRLGVLARAPGGGWLVSFIHEPEVVVLDGALLEVERLDLHAQSQKNWRTGAAMSRDGRLIALCTRDELRLHDRTGEMVWQTPHQARKYFDGSDCLFDKENRLWYVRPVEDSAGQDNSRRYRPQPKVLTIVEPNSGIALFEHGIVSDDGHFSLIPCPDEESVIIDVGCGQDEGLLFLARLTDGRLTLDQYDLGDRVIGGNFSPSGLEFATTEHGRDDLQVHAFPAGSVVATVDSEMLFGRDELPVARTDGLGWQALFLDDDHILATTAHGRMCLFRRKDMALLAVVFAEGHALTGYDQAGKPTQDADRIVDFDSGLTSIHPTIDPARLLALYDQTTLCLLDVAPLLSR